MIVVLVACMHNRHKQHFKFFSVQNDTRKSKVIEVLAAFTHFQISFIIDLASDFNQGDLTES